MKTVIITPATKNFKFTLNPIAEAVECPECPECPPAQTGCFPMGKRFGWVDRSAPENWLDGVSPCDTLATATPLEWYKCSSLLYICDAYNVFVEDMSARTLRAYKQSVDSGIYYRTVPLDIYTNSDVWTIRLGEGNSVTGQIVWSFELVDIESWSNQTPPY